MALLAVSAFVAAAIQATTGIGFALVLGPVLFALLDPVPAVAVLTALGIALNLLVLAGERRRPRVAWGEVGPMLAAAAPGAAIGVVVLRALPKPALQLGVGLAVVGAVVVQLAVRPSPNAAPGDPRARLALGFASGTLATSAGVTGPPIALWLARRGLRPAEVRDSLSAAFLGLGLIGAVVLAPVVAGGVDVSPWALVAGLACVVAGHAAGSRAFARLHEARYQPLLLACVLVAGLASAAAGVVGLSAT
ncbi:MAG TPA: sulfite exporter TauE/SafE family protein [Solirubrobacteraceae bacterium]|nr:sulfite exporter TauE/SafE family protein [Solirubrobacteraceae bacterium]